jgi:hypothetical protein
MEVIYPALNELKRKKQVSQFSAGNSHGKFVVEGELEVSL